MLQKEVHWSEILIPKFCLGLGVGLVRDSSTLMVPMILFRSGGGSGERFLHSDGSYDSV